MLAGGRVDAVGFWQHGGSDSELRGSGIRREDHARFAGAFTGESNSPFEQLTRSRCSNSGAPLLLTV